jgi:hypothetical protein
MGIERIVLTGDAFVLAMPDEHARRYLIQISALLENNQQKDADYNQYATMLGITPAQLMTCVRSKTTLTVREIVKRIFTREQIAAYKNKDDVCLQIRTAIHGKNVNGISKNNTYVT